MCKSTTRVVLHCPATLDMGHPVHLNTLQGGALSATCRHPTSGCGMRSTREGSLKISQDNPTITMQAEAVFEDAMNSNFVHRSAPVDPHQFSLEGAIMLGKVRLAKLA